MDLRRQAALERQRLRSELNLSRNATAALLDAAEADKAVSPEHGGKRMEDDAELALGRRFRALGSALLGAAGPRLDPANWAALTGRGGPKLHLDLPGDSFYELVRRGRREPGHRTARIEPEDQLRESAAAGDVDGVINAIEANAFVDAASARGVTPLMVASASDSKNALSVIQELLERDASMDAVDRGGWNCLHYACRSGRNEVMRCLLLKRADPLEVTKDRQTILMLAVLEGKIDAVREMFREKAVHGTLSYPDKTGATALHYSVMLKDSKMLKLLLDYKGKIHNRDAMGRTVLSWACEYSSIDLVKVLCKKHADVHAPDAEGRAALYYAILAENEASALFLLNAGADQNKKDVDGVTPKALAKERGLNEVIHTMKVISGAAL